MSRPWWTMEPPPVSPQTVLYPPSGHRSSHSSGSGGGSIGTLVVVLAVITILGVLAGVVARVCGGRHLAGGGDYDFEGWVEEKCATCIDGSVVLPPVAKSSDAAAEAKEEEKKEEESKDAESAAGAKQAEV